METVWTIQEDIRADTEVKGRWAQLEGIKDNELEEPWQGDNFRIRQHVDIMKPRCCVFPRIHGAKVTEEINSNRSLVCVEQMHQ